MKPHVKGDKGNSTPKFPGVICSFEFRWSYFIIDSRFTQAIWVHYLWIYSSALWVPQYASSFLCASSIREMVFAHLLQCVFVSVIKRYFECHVQMKFWFLCNSAHPHLQSGPLCGCVFWCVPPSVLEYLAGCWGLNS